MLATICLFKFANIFHLNLSNIVHGQIQKQPPEVLCKKRCSYKFLKIHRKTPVPEFLFNKVRLHTATLLKKRFWHKCIFVNFPKFLRKHLLQSTSGRQLLHMTLCSTYLLNDKNYIFPDDMFLCFLFVSFISVNLLILNYRGIKSVIFICCNGKF